MRNSYRYHNKVLKFAIAAGFCVIATSLSGQSIILAATGPSANKFMRGSKLPNNKKLTLKARDKVTVFDKIGTRVMRGPGTFLLDGKLRYERDYDKVKKMLISIFSGGRSIREDRELFIILSEDDINQNRHLRFDVPLRKSICESHDCEKGEAGEDTLSNENISSNDSKNSLAVPIERFKSYRPEIRAFTADMSSARVACVFDQGNFDLWRYGDSPDEEFILSDGKGRSEKIVFNGRSHFAKWPSSFLIGKESKFSIINSAGHVNNIILKRISYNENLVEFSRKTAKMDCEQVAALFELMSSSNSFPDNKEIRCLYQGRCD